MTDRQWDCCVVCVTDDSILNCFSIISQSGEKKYHTSHRQTNTVLKEMNGIRDVFKDSYPRHSPIECTNFHFPIVSLSLSLFHGYLLWTDRVDEVRDGVSLLKLDESERRERGWCPFSLVKRFGFDRENGKRGKFFLNECDGQS